MKSVPDPTQLNPVDKESGVLQVVIETPAGSRNKFAWDHEQGVFVLRKVLPAGMAFPYDFGFLPQTKAADGDPLDILVLMDEPAFPGCAVRARAIGVIEGEQTEGGKTVRNDRLVAVAEASHEYADAHTLKDLPEKWMDEVAAFFVQYQRLEGKEYRLLGSKGPKAAEELMVQARKPAREAA